MWKSSSSIVSVLEDRVELVRLSIEEVYPVRSTVISSEVIRTDGFVVESDRSKVISVVSPSRVASSVLPTTNMDAVLGEATSRRTSGGIVPTTITESSSGSSVSSGHFPPASLLNGRAVGRPETDPSLLPAGAWVEALEDVRVVSWGTSPTWTAAMAGDRAVTTGGLPVVVDGAGNTSPRGSDCTKLRLLSVKSSTSRTAVGVAVCSCEGAGGVVTSSRASSSRLGVGRGGAMLVENMDGGSEGAASGDSSVSDAVSGE